MYWRNLTFLACVVAWEVLCGEGRVDKGSGGNAGGKPQAEATHISLGNHSVQPLNNAKALDPEEPGFSGPFNTSIPGRPSSKPARLMEVPNSSKFNASSSPPFPSAPSALHIQTKTTGGSIHPPYSPAQPSGAYSPPRAPQFVSSNVLPTDSNPNQIERIAEKALAAHRSYKPVNFSDRGDFALPNWVRAPRVLTTQRNYSRVYRLPSWESSLYLFGVKSNGEVRIALLPNDKDETSMNISIYGRGGDTEIYFNSSNSSQVEVSRHSITLTLSKHTWFILFRKKHFLAIHVAGTAAPILVYEHLQKNVDFLSYTRFQVWSKKKAQWDLIGRAYKNENKGTSPTDEAVKEELRGIEEGLAERFGLIINLVGILQRPSIVDNLTLSDIQEIKDIGESVLPLRSILFYYDFIRNKNMYWTSV